MAVTSSSVLTAPVNRIFQEMLLRNAKVRAPYFVGSQAAEIQPMKGSFVALWRRIENLTPTTTALTEIAAESYPTRTGETLSITSPTATVAKYGQVLFLTEEVELVNFNTQAAKLVEIMAISAGASLNRLQRNVNEDNATLIYADGASADSGVSSPISRNLIKATNNVLQRNSAMKFAPGTQGANLEGTSPIRPAYWGLCHVDVEEDIRALEGFIAVERYASQTAVQNGEFGALDGVRFVSSEDASIDANSGAAVPAGVRSTAGTNADLYTTIIFGMEAVGSLGFGSQHVKEIYMAGDMLPPIQMINKARGSAGTADPMDEIRTMAWKAWHAGTVLNANWVRGIRHAASKLT